MHEELKGWLEWLGIDDLILHPLHGDASARRYYRLETGETEGMVMDASDMKESVPVFIGVAWRLMDTKIRIPTIKSYELNKGFIFLEDIGSVHLFDKHTQANAAEYYEKAIRVLVAMQNTPSQGLAPYDEMFLLEEMNLMPQWYLKEYLHQTLECVEARMLLESFSLICKEVLSQPQGIFVHRDYHAKNLMIDTQGEIVVIDFQDAKEGALMYDLVSLLRDVYVELDAKEVQRLVLMFRDLKGLEVDDKTFMRWFDFTGLQRHIKILGIFARLSIRDGKDGYLKDIPLTLQYIEEVGSKYPELHGLLHLLKTKKRRLSV